MPSPGDRPEVDVYAVGMLRDWQHARRTGEYRSRWRRFCLSWRRRSYWNGYLAEPEPFPSGVARCGSGWTKRRALRSLDRQIRKAHR